MPKSQYTVVSRKKRDTNLAVRTGGAPTHPLPKKPKKKKTYAQALQTKKKGRPTTASKGGKTVSQLRKEATAKRKRECPPVSGMNRSALERYLKT
jgi:hypothetical protein